MKTPSHIWILALILLAPLTLRAQITIANAPLSMALQIYRSASGLELITSSHVNTVRAEVTVQPPGSIEKPEMLKLIEKALLEQAGIVITKLDDKRVSVTYNDALPVKRVQYPAMLMPTGPDGKPLTPSMSPQTVKPLQK